VISWPSFESQKATEFPPIPPPQTRIFILAIVYKVFPGAEAVVKANKKYLYNMQLFYLTVEYARTTALKTQ
jgi:hypothetical protein